MVNLRLVYTIPAIILSTSVALCLTVASESLSRDFKLAPMPENENNIQIHKTLVFGGRWLSGVTRENSFFGLELRVSQILVNPTFMMAQCVK